MRVRFPNSPLGLPFDVRYHPGAEVERDALQASDRDEFKALLSGIDKLRALGDQLPAPHSSAIKGATGKGLRELRLRAGRSRTRAIYRRFGDIIVILAIGPEAQFDRAGFDAAVTRAAERAAEIEIG